MKKPAENRTRLVVLEAPETSPWARIRALEARLADVEKRHAEAIARLAQALENLVSEGMRTLDRTEERVTKTHLIVDALVPAAARDVFDEWDRECDAENVEEFERVRKLDAVVNPKKRERERRLDFKERTRELNAAGPGQGFVLERLRPRRRSRRATT